MARGRPWLYPLLLAVPFLCGIAVLKGLTTEIDTFHGSDARVFHLPTILQFAHALPGLRLHSYPAAQTPLFHLLFAVYGKAVGFEPWKLRLLNVVISYLAVLALYRLLARLGLGRGLACALALVFALSPYFFGASFTLLTDNLAILFGLLALERFHRFQADGSLATFALGALSMGAAVLTRQAFLWLGLVAAYVLVRSRAPIGRRVAAAALAGLALAPFAALVAYWGGLAPVGANASSCGLCNTPPGVGHQALTLRPVGFTIAIFGLYAAVTYLPVVAGRLRTLRWSSLRSVGVPLAVGVVLLAVSPLVYRPISPGHAGDAGYLWKLADRSPVVLSSELLFWVLVPVGAVALFLLVRRAGLGSLPAVYFAAFLVAAVPVRIIYQKYFDPFALLAVMMLVRPTDLRGARDYAGLAALGVGFVAYAISFAG